MSCILDSVPSLRLIALFEFVIALQKLFANVVENLFDVRVKFLVQDATYIARQINFAGVETANVFAAQPPNEIAKLKDNIRSWPAFFPTLVIGNLLVRDGICDFVRRQNDKGVAYITVLFKLFDYSFAF